MAKISGAKKETPKVSTDKADYAPGATALLKAEGFTAGSTLEFRVQHVVDPGRDLIWGTTDDQLGNNTGQGHAPWSITDGGAGDLDGLVNGKVQTSWYVDPDDSLGARFLLTVTGSAPAAITVKTDAPAPAAISLKVDDAPAPAATNSVTETSSVTAPAVNSAAVEVATTTFTDSNPLPVQFFYVPKTEAQLFLALQTIESGGPSPDPVNPVYTYISIAAVANGTVIYYDHWEDGYETNIANPTQSSTQIWGDGILSNGVAPGTVNDLINAGTVLVLNNAVDTNAPLPTDYDGGDKVAATKTVAMTRIGWASGSDTLLTSGLEVFDTSNYGTDYQIPVGVDIPDDTDFQMFEYTGIFIQAGQFGASVSIDTDANGVFDTYVDLSEGESYLVNGGVKVGARVMSDNPVQVGLLTGDIGSNYESRDAALLPLDLWSNSYYTPVSTYTAADASGAKTSVWLYNPGASDITVKLEYRVAGVLTTDTLIVPGGPAGGYLKQIIPDGSGAHFYTTSGDTTSGENFYAISTTDSANAFYSGPLYQYSGNQNFDWGFDLVPETSLTTQVLVGLGLGRDPNSNVNPGENGSPVWITPVGNGETPATIYVDYNGDNLTNSGTDLTDGNGFHYDATLSLKELERAKVFDPDGNQTGMLLYTLDPNVKLAAAWGEDPSTASIARPGIDTGTGVTPLPTFDAGKNSALKVDADGDGYTSPGDTLLYTVSISNASRAPVLSLLLQDTLSADVSYVTGSTRINTGSGFVSLADAGTTAFPLDEGGSVLGDLAVGGNFTVTFEAKIDAFADLTPGVKTIINTGKVSSGDLRVPLLAVDPLYGSIGDFVWKDLNADGVQDGGAETGINGVTVKLYLDANNNDILDGPDTLITSKVTAGNGDYLFTGLLAGKYIVDVVDSTVPSNYQLTTNNDPKPVDLAGGQDYLQADFGYLPLSSLSGYVYYDADDDGVKDPGEPGISGVSIKLNGTDITGQPVLKNVTTAADGSYSFTDLRPSNPSGYTVSELAQPGPYLDGKDTAGTTGGNVTDDKISSIVLGAGVNSTDNNFGELLPASISGYVYKDTLNDGVWDGVAAGIGGVTVNLTGTDDLGNSVNKTATTDSDGSYSFLNLRPGTYIVTEIQPASYLDGKDTAGSAGGNATAVNDQISAIVLNSGVSSVNNNFGELVPANLSGYVYVDLNNNGLKGGGEAGIGNVTVTLTGTNDLGVITPVAITTDSAGFYNFQNLRPGTYTVTETQPPSYLDGKDTAGSAGGNAVAVNDQISGIVLNQGDDSVDNNFGELTGATVSGFVYLDANNNGIRTGPPNEPGISGVTVTLTGNNDLGIAVSVTTTTDSTGAYSFTGLRPSSPTGYLVTESQPANYVDGKDTAGSAGGNATAVNDQISGIVVAASGSSANNNFGELLPVSVSGFVYVDNDNDGVKDVGEAGIGSATPGAGVTVRLTGNNDLGQAITLTTTTAADGAYSFTGLRPSSLFGYTVTETQPAGYVDGKDTAGSAGGIVTVNDVISGIVLLTGGSSSTNNNFGELLGGDLSITKTDGLTTVSPGQTITYTIVASNAGPSAATNALVSDTMPSNLTNVHWTSVATGGASANQLTGTGNINDTVNLVAGSSITYTVTGTLAETVANFATAGTINTSLTQNITVNGVRADAYYNVGGTSYQTTNTVLWERNDDPSDHGIGVVSNGETGSAGGDVNEISHQLNNDVIRLTKADGQQWSSLWVSSLDVNGSGSAETGTFYWSNSATPNLNTLSTKFTFQYGDFGNSVEEGNVLALHPSNFDATAKYLFFVAGPNPAGDNNDYLLWKAATIPTTLTNTATVTGPTGFPDTNPNNNSATDTDVIQKASIGDFVWCDTNGDGLQTAGELGVSGVTVELLDSSNAVVATTTTNSSGNYSFANLDPGDYKVHVVKPAGYQSFTTANQGGNDALDSDVATTTGITSVTTLVAGENDTSWDAGFKPNVATSITYDFSGSDSATTGSNGNTATHTVSGVSVTANAWSRTQDTGQTWNAAHLGSYGSGNGVTDTSEDGSSPNHAVDNSGRDNFVVYRFSEPVTVDKIGLGYVDTDSDISVWIGNTTDPVTSMSNAVLASMSVINEENLGGSSTRTADINSGNVSGNTVIVAAKLGNSNDFFKIETMQVKVGVLVTPIAIDLNGNGLDTVALAGSTGKFDLFGNGSEVKSGWLSKDDGFLAIDANHNGKIDGINELFGGNKAGEGFAELIAFDSNGDLVVNASDAHFLDLSVWRDSNGNHKTDAGELMNLTQAGVVSLSVDYDSANTFWDAQGNQHLEHSTATLADGHVVDMTDINFAVAANTAATAAAPSALSAGFAFA